jgi:hypothetical protein
MKSKAIPVLHPLYSFNHPGAEERAYEGYGQKSIDAGDIPQQKSARRKEGGISGEIELVQIQELQRDPVPKVNISQSKTYDDG